MHAPRFDRPRTPSLRSFATLATLLLLPATAVAQAQWPSRPITVVNGNAAGGTPDILVRTLVEELRPAFPQGIVVVNRTGANGTIAAESVRRASPDGHTLLFATMTTMAVNPHLQKDARYHGARDFEPIATQVLQPLIWATSKHESFRTLNDVVEQARKNPGRINASRQGFGASSHLTVAALTARNQVDFNLIGFTGSSDTFAALRRGDVQLMVDLPQSMLPRIASGEVVPLAITSAQRIRALPNLPTWIEQGVMENELTAWYVYLAPKGTPAAIVTRLNAEINRVLEQPAFRQRLEDVGGIVRTLSPAQLRTFMEEEHERWGRILRSAEIRPQN
ncbi:MAG: Bug family tripartite tricarboxylate transporter substrate binding protein [Pseudomonadota bacterium]|jgi:tripartite-type tricarboxylate transporter receptor subunit TctC